jgi:hypothetical protein
MKFHASVYLRMTALIIYNDFGTAASANAVLQHSIQHRDISVQWQVRPWRLDVLELSPAAEEALNEAINARLIIFAGHLAQLTPSWL